MSRGTLTIETVEVAGSSETTIIVSVRYVRRPTPASTPTISALMRSLGGALGDGESEPLAEGEAEAGRRKLGSGAGVIDGSTAATGGASTKIWSAVSRATSVPYAA